MVAHGRKILIVEDSPSTSKLCQAALMPLQADLTAVYNGADALAFLAETTPDLVLLDLKLPDMNGMDILAQITKAQKTQAPTAVVVMTAHASVQIAVDAMQQGARDFLLKPFQPERLRTTVANILELARLNNLVAELGSGRDISGFANFIGESPPMQAVYRMVQDAAPSRVSVFITGESGTGKELCAEAIHSNSPRRDHPFITINCAAIPANLMESEIFGHVKGAFTGAMENRAGAAVKADGGTLFLDEICEMPLDLQAKLLRFIQSGQVVPVGSNDVRQVNVRFVCATNRDPLQAVRDGLFREDLYYRLHVIPIMLPPLRARGDDVCQLAESMLQRFSREEGKAFTHLSGAARQRLMAYPWPGNVRELSNVIQSTVVLHEGEELSEDMVARMLGGVPQPDASFAPPVNAAGAWAPTLAADILPLAVVERAHIEAAVQHCDGHVRDAAKKLGVNASTLYRKIKSWETS